MNKTQKTAWYVLLKSLLATAILGSMFYICFKPFGQLSASLARFWYVVAVGYCILTFIGIIFLLRKQSSVEVASDERDKLITKRAICVSFISVWILLIASVIILHVIVGAKGSIPVWTLIFINAEIFFITMLVYSIAILVQYGWGGRDGGE